MIKIEQVHVSGWEAAIRGMRNPMNSWEQSDSVNGAGIGQKDLDLMKRLAAAGSDHRKFMRYINVTLDITAPLYWWKEYDTYKVGTVANSCSTMHRIHEKEFTIDDFSHEHLFGTAEVVLEHIIITLNLNRDRFNESGHKDKQSWWNMIQLLPSSYNQRRTVQLNYEVLRHIYHARKAHKLDEWQALCAWIETLPHSELITMKGGAFDGN